MMRFPSLAILLLWLANLARGFQPHLSRPCSLRLKSQFPTKLALSKKDYDQGGVGKGNWIEKSSPVDTTEGVSAMEVDGYDLGISGEAFQTGPLSKQMFDTIVSSTSLEMSDEIRQAYTLYAMDVTAKEATRAACKQNGLQMVLQEEEEDQGMWGDIEAIRLYDEKTGIAFSTLYDSLEDALKNWTPGQTFDFVVRQVPAKSKEHSTDELVQALDPDGSLREEAKNLKGEDYSPDEEALRSIFDDNDIASLADFANENVRRTANAPKGATVEGEAFAGGDSRGYRVINRSDLLGDSRNPDGSENQKSESQEGKKSLLEYKLTFAFVASFISADARDGCPCLPWSFACGCD